MAPSTAARALPPPPTLPCHVQRGQPESLIERTAAGQADALAELFCLHGPAVHAIAFRLTRSADDADDVVQDVFIGLPESLRRYEDHGQFDAWLARVTTRTALMRLRHARRHVDLDSGDGRAAATHEGDALDARLTIEQAVSQLGPVARDVFIRRGLEGRSHAEIASELGITRNSSEVRFFRALRQLRSFLRNSR